MSGTAASDNTNNTGALSTQYSSDLTQHHNSRYWVPTSSKLSRGKKDTIQRMFTGEPLKNMCNVYVYNQTTESWYHEHTILGNPNRSGSQIYPVSDLNPNATSSGTTVGGITYYTSASFNNPDSFGAFSRNPQSPSSWATEDMVTSIIHYPRYQPAGWSGGTWVPGTYVGTTSLGGYNGEWVKIQVSTPIQPTVFKFMPNQIEQRQFETWTILGSNNDINWTSLGSFSVPPSFSRNNPIANNLTINTTYSYFAIVFTKRYEMPSFTWNPGESVFIEVSNSYFYTEDPSEDFGRSLDGTDNADMVAIGGPGTWFGSVSNNNGYAKVFTKDSSGNGWTQRGSEVSQQGGFGHSVALSQYDGNILVVGAPFYNTLDPNSSGSTQFHHVLVSEGKVYIYKWDGANYTLQQTLNSPSGTLSTSITPAPWKNFYFGYSLGITDIGDKIIIGEPSIRNIWTSNDQLHGGANGSWTTNSFPYTGNAHVYDNVTVLSGGTTWTSNVSMTSVIGITGIGSSDGHPSKVRWLDALGTSVDINRAGTRILAGAPGNYGTSSSAYHAFMGRVYTLNWNYQNNAWEEMGQESKHISPDQGNMLFGWSTRFDGSGNRIVSGAPGYMGHIQYNKGNVVINTWNGEHWVVFPNDTVDIRGWNTIGDYWTDYNHRLGESISVDGEGEWVSIGKYEHHYANFAPSGGLRPNAFNVDNITYIGGASTTVAGSNSDIDTGMSNVWTYYIVQSMVVKGNVSVGGIVQGTGVCIGTNDDSSTSNKSIFFGGTKSDNSYQLTVIENRVYETEEKAELLLFKGDDNADASGGGTYGPDRIRLKAGQIAFDLNTGTTDVEGVFSADRSSEDIRCVMHRNAGGAGMLGINVSSPTECVHVDGKIKCTQGFVGRGKELTGLDFDYINNNNVVKFGLNGVTQSPTKWGTLSVGSAIAYPTVTLTSNSYSGYTVTASRDVANAYTVFGGGRWQIGDNTVYSNGANRGGYLGSTERIAGYKGEWIELQMPDKIYLTRLDVNADYFYTPRITHVFGSNDGIEYDLIHYSGDLGYLWTSNHGNKTIFTRTPDYINDEPYNRILIIVNMISGGNVMYWDQVDIYGTIGTFTPKVYIDNSGKIGIVNTNPSYPLDVTGDINLTGALRIGGVAQSFGGGGGGSSVWSLNSVNAYYNSGNVGIGTSTPAYKLDVNGDINMSTGSSFRINGVAQSFGGGSSFSGDIADYITHTGNTTTKFGFPADNEFLINISGTHAIIINSNGETTIGDDSDIGSGHKLTVVDGSTLNNGSYADLVITNMNEHNNARLLLGTPHQTTSSSAFKAAIIADGAGTYSRNDLHFCLENSTDNAANADLTDSKMVIKYDTGNVGIGTSTPVYKLDVNGDINMSTGSSFRINGVAQTFGGGSSFSGDIADYITHTGDTNTYFGFPSDDTFIINTNGTERLRANSSGNIGIGTTTPAYKLDVDGDINMSTGSSFRINGVAQTFGGGGGSSPWTTGSAAGTYPPSAMVSNGSGGYGSSASSTNYPPTFDVFKAFNQTISDEGWHGTGGQYSSTTRNYIGSFSTTYDGGSSSVSGEWIQLQFPSSTSIAEIEIAPRSGSNNYLNRCAGDGIILGSTNGSTWTSIATFSGKTYTTGNYTSITFAASSSYTYFRVVITKLSGSSGESVINISELRFKGGNSIYYPSSGSSSVGIGTTSPSYTLDVDGDINMSTGSSFRINGVAQTFGGGGGGSSPWTTSGSNIYRSSGQVNIGGSTFTRAKLEINGSYSSYLLYRYYAYGSYGYTASGTNSYGIYCNQRIAANEFNAHSDIRIKKNITDINDSSALDKIRLLEPKIYNYIDEKARGTSNVYGFIAQEVANVLPYAVTVSEGDIPNILTNSNVSVIDSNVLELRLDTTVEGLTLSNTSVINIITDKDKDLKCNVLSFSENNVITIENTDEFSNVTNAFIKGEQVSNFHHLNKDAIWAVSTAALQEVDRQLQTEKAKVSTLETQVANLLARVSALENT